MKQRGEGAGGKTLIKHARKSANISRQKLLQLRRQAMAVKRKKVELQKEELKKAASKRIQSARNKKTHKTFDHSMLRCVQGGLVESIESLGETVTPLSLFMAAFTTLQRSPEKHHIPYILAISSACAPHLSQGILMHQLEPAITLTEQIIAENVASNYLIVTKAMIFAQQLILSIQPPTMRVLSVFSRLEPSKLQVDTMKLYIVAFRKLLERAALSGSVSSSSSHPVRDAHTGAYILSENQKFFVEALPRFVKLCVANFTDAPASVVSSTASELAGLFQRTLSPYIVESEEGREMLNSIVSTQLLELLKPHCQIYWGYALEVMEPLFDRLNYLKRTPAGDAMPFTQRFPSFPFVLRVLNKLRAMDDSKLNGKIERVMVAIGKGMTVQEFVNIIPFDPRRAHDAELQGADSSAEEEAWANSYVLNVLRRIASHDSLPFFVEHFFPLIQFSRGVALEYEKQQRMELSTKWTALLLQYWRVGVGFCHYPRTITKESFRDLAKQLVGLMSHPMFVDTSATALHVLCDGYYELATMESLDDDMDETTSDNNNAGDEEERLDDDQRTATGNRKKRPLPPKNSLEEDTHFLSLNDSTWNRHVYHGISQETAKDVCENVIARFSANIMPKLCNTFESHDSTAVLLAIQSFSRVCTPDVMQVILKGVLDLGTNIALQTQEKEFSGVKKPNHTPLTGKRRMVLDISCAVIAQIPSEHVVTLFNDIIEPVLMDPAPESRLLQKKAYKLLFAMFEHRIKDIFPLFPRIAGLLTVGRQHVTISGIKMRLRCLVWALDACKMYYPDQIVSMIRTIVGETIMLSRERSSETRTASMDLLEKMQRYLVSGGNPINMLLHLVLAGFSGKTPWMISSTVVAMAKLVYITHQELPEADLEAAIALGIRMMESAEQDVRSSAAMFARMVLKLMKRCKRVAAAMEKSLPKLLLAIALTTSQPRVSSNTRLQMRVLLEKCIKRFGFERLEPIFPVGSKNFLRYTQKMMRREQKKEERELKKRAEEKKDEFDRLFLGAAMKAGTEDDAERDLLQAGALTSFVSAYAVPSLGGGANADEGGDEFDTMHLEFQDGKLHIMSIEEKRQQMERKRREEMANRLLRRGNHMAHADSLNEGALGMRGKRSRDDAEDFENEELILRYGNKINNESAQKTIAAVQSRVGPGANQIEKLRSQKLEKRELKRMRLEEDIRKGDEFKGTGEGDVRRGNLAPYAYIPLNRQYMNKRHQREAVQRLMTVAHPHMKGNKAKLAIRKKKSS